MLVLVLVVVISPLKSLMLDQVQSYKNEGIKAVCICADDEEARQCYHSVLKGEYQVIYISPELVFGKKM